MLDKRFKLFTFDIQHSTYDIRYSTLMTSITFILFKQLIVTFVTSIASMD